MANKSFNNVKLNTVFKTYTDSTFQTLSSGENIAHSLGKIKYWMDNINTFIDTYEFLDGDAESGVATWQYKKNDGAATAVQIYGVPTLVDGVIPSTFLPSYVDDVLEGVYDPVTKKFYEDATKTKELEAEKGKIYLDISRNPAVAYRYSGSEYFSISSSSSMSRFAQDADGAVPGPTAAQIAANSFLRADGTWVAPSDIGHVMEGATASKDGKEGFVPQPLKGGFTEYTTVNNQFLCGDGSWSTAPVITNDTLTLNCVPDDATT